ncbi:MAG: hypothetical protein R2882_12625 [Gemmatimonadales bacterium]
MRAPASLLLLVAISGCGISGRGTNCGIVALAGPTLLLEEFTKPGKTLSSVPDGMPPVLPVRIAAGLVQRGLVGQTDSSWVIGIDGPLPDLPDPGFGVLVADPVAGPQGVLVYEGPPILRAPILGSVHLGERSLPLIGLRASAAAFEDSRCRLFPDSLRQ